MNTIYVLIPVYNRLSDTQEILKNLRDQKQVSLKIVVVNDGSTDGTADFLARQTDLIVLTGNGTLWWAGAIKKAMDYVKRNAKTGDYFMLINNDTRIDDNFILTQVKVSESYDRAIVGSVLRSLDKPHRLLSIGPRADLWSMRTWDQLDDLVDQDLSSLSEVYQLDFLPGRNTLFPFEVISRVGALRPRLLPHYFADYEYTDRARRAGFRLLVSSRAVTYSADAGSNGLRRYSSPYQRWFGRGSPENILHRRIFYLLVGSPVQRLTALPRMAWWFLSAKTYRPLAVIRRYVKRIIQRLISLIRQTSALTWKAIALPYRATRRLWRKAKVIALRDDR